jgi:glycine cleavage system H protein
MIPMKIDNSLYYSKQHLWVRQADSDEFIAGITDYAQDLLGDIVFIEFPAIGHQLTADESCGLVESVKTGSDLHAPMNGIVTEVNYALQSNPEQINDKPYQAWIFKFKPSNTNDIEKLLSADDYQKMVATS